jgi:hypothetical protein
MKPPMRRNRSASNIEMVNHLRAMRREAERLHHAGDREQARLVDDLAAQFEFEREMARFARQQTGGQATRRRIL